MSPPPGWYPDGSLMRWWDGHRWGPVGPPVPPVQTEVESGRPLATISHLGPLAMWFVIPLVMRLTAGKDNAFVRHHASEALNFQILFAIVWNVSLGPPFIQQFLHPTQGFGITLAIGMPIALTALVLNFTFSIRGAIMANRGTWWRYPINLRLVRGAAPRQSTAPS